MIINIRHTQVRLLPQKALFFPIQKILVIADMHLGKLIHFRRKGIFVPTSEANEDLETMVHLIKQFEPKEVVFLGDLFHSEVNSEYYRFVIAITMFPQIKFTLTKGNHDVIPTALFEESRVEIVKERVLENNVVLMHQLPKKLLSETFYIIGHIHPGYVVQGKGRQSYRLPCFCLSAQSLILPAFGMHTGLFIPDFLATDVVYVILNEEVVKIPY